MSKVVIKVSEIGYNNVGITEFIGALCAKAVPEVGEIDVLKCENIYGSYKIKIRANAPKKTITKYVIALFYSDERLVKHFRLEGLY